MNIILATIRGLYNYKDPRILEVAVEVPVLNGHLLLDLVVVGEDVIPLRLMVGVGEEPRNDGRRHL